jgi:hypothetical protein
MFYRSVVSTRAGGSAHFTEFRGVDRLAIVATPLAGDSRLIYRSGGTLCCAVVFKVRTYRRTVRIGQVQLYIPWVGVIYRILSYIPVILHLRISSTAYISYPQYSDNVAITS